MALAHINNRVQGGGQPTGLSIVAPNTGSVAHTAGNGLIALIDVLYNQGHVTTITNTAGDNANWTKLGEYDEPNIFNHYEIWYVNSTLGHAADVVTVNLSATSQFRSLIVHEISGQNASGMAGNTANGFSLTGTAIASGTVTVTAAEEIIFAIMAGIGPPISAGSGYTLSTFNLDGTNNYYADEYKIVSASEAATASMLTSNQWAIFAGSFKAASTGGAVIHRLASLGVGA